MAIDWGQLVLGPNLTIFGEPCTYLAGDGTPFAITGIFDEAYLASDQLTIEGITPMHISNSRPVLGVRLSDFPQPPQQGDLVTVRGVQYWIQEPQPDGRGGAKLLLNVQDGQR